MRGNPCCFVIRRCGREGTLDEIDIWRTAKRRIRQRGLHVQYRAMVRASELKAQTDAAGAAGWLRVFDAIDELWQTERLTSKPLQ